MKTTSARLSTPGPLRCLVVGVSGGAALLALGWLCLASTVPVLSRLSEGTATPADPAAPVLVIAGVAGAFACLYLCVIVARTAWTAARGGLVRTDGLVRRLTLAACGTALAVTALAPAHAADLSDLDGLPLPERPTSSATALTETPPLAPNRAPARTPSPTEAPRSVDAAHPEPSVTATPATETSSRPATAANATPTTQPTVQPSAAPVIPVVPRTSPHGTSPSTRPDAPTETTRHHQADFAAQNEASELTHLVRPGDTLWGLATDLLSARTGVVPPTQMSIAGLVQKIHDSNRSVIGSDPDLLLPGQELSLPRTEIQEKR